jgi:plastocyanin
VVGISLLGEMMNHKYLWMSVLFGWLLSALLTGCAAPGDEITFEVTFDENHNCTVSGPTEVPTGDYLISLNNLSERKVDVAVTHLIDGHNYQDLLNLQSDFGEPFVKVYWMSQPYYFTKDHKVWTYSFDESGEHVILILQHVFEGVWICDPFYVIEAPTE